MSLIIDKYLKNKSAVIFDIFFCVVFMPLLVFLGPSHTWLTQWPVFFCLACTFLYACYFTIQKMNFPSLLIGKKYVTIISLLMILVVLNCVLSLYPLPEMDFVTPVLSRYQTELRNFGVSVTLWLMFSLVIGYSLSVSFVKELYGQLLIKRELETQRDKAELAALKAQISPHFLFNTLNSLYSLVIGTSEKAEEAFIQFTDILKYTYVVSEKETVSIKEEVKIIHSYINLQEIRFNKHTQVDCKCDVDDPEVQVPPMLMMTFVENAFKYGCSTSKDCEIKIRLNLKEGKLEFKTFNRIMKQADKFRDDIPVGIENCRNRLSAVYPGKHSLELNEENGVYQLRLNIDL